MDVSLVDEIELEDEQWEPLLNTILLTNYRLSPINRVVYEIDSRQGDWADQVLLESEVRG